MPFIATSAAICNILGRIVPPFREVIKENAYQAYKVSIDKHYAANYEGKKEFNAGMEAQNDMRSQIKSCLKSETYWNLTAYYAGKHAESKQDQAMKDNMYLTIAQNIGLSR